VSSLEEALYAKLTGDKTGDEALMRLVTGVYNGIAPPEATYPFILFQLLRAGDSYTLGSRVSTAYVYRVEWLADGYSAQGGWTAMARVDTLLTDQALVVDSQNAWRVRRDSKWAYVEPHLDGKVFQHVGADWGITVPG